MTAKQRTALVVEDNPLVAMDAREMLAHHGFDPIHVFSSAEFGEGLVRHEPPDFALVVACLDNGDIAPLAALLTAQGVPFGFVSDFVSGQDIPSDFQCRQFVTKPYAPQDLATLLGNLGLLGIDAAESPGDAQI